MEIFRCYFDFAYLLMCRKICEYKRTSKTCNWDIRVNDNHIYQHIWIIDSENNVIVHLKGYVGWGISISLAFVFIFEDMHSFNHSWSSTCVWYSTQLCVKMPTHWRRTGITKLAILKIFPMFSKSHWFDLSLWTM